MTQENSIEQRLAEIPSIIAVGTICYATQEERDAVRAISREELRKTLEHYRNDGRTLYNEFHGAPRLAEDFALEQVGSLAFLRMDAELRNRVAARYRELAESATDEVDKEDFFQAASHYEVN